MGTTDSRIGAAKQQEILNFTAACAYGTDIQESGLPFCRPEIVQFEQLELFYDELKFHFPGLVQSMATRARPWHPTPKISGDN